MKTTLSSLFALIFSSSALSTDFPAYKIFTGEGKESDFSKVVKGTEDKNYVFFGEYHDNPISHWLQFELTREMYAVHSNHLSLGAEMFEADNQYIFDEYLKDQISEKNFQNEVRLWPNYNTDYKPLVEFAKKFKIPFIATNIPRRYANVVFKGGTEPLNALSELAKSFMVPLNEFVFDSTVTCYKDLLESMEHGGLFMAMAQAIKDATMSYFLLKNSKKNSVFLHFNGTYHSDHYQGIVHYLLKSVSRDQIMTISTVVQADISSLEEGNENLADFIICVPETMTSTH